MKNNSRPVIGSHSLNLSRLTPVLLTLLWAGCSSGPPETVNTSKKAGADVEYGTKTDNSLPDDTKDATPDSTQTSSPLPTPVPTAPKPTTPSPSPTPTTPVVTTPDANGWKLVWSDEFNGTEIDKTKWNFELLKPGAFNNELQGYTNRSENAHIDQGHLVIEARKDNFEGQAYTSARMNSKGKGFWKYGKVEARLKFTSALGTWPAFWMMPEDQSKGWPACGEIDIMENVGYEGSIMHGTTHTKAFYGVNGRGGPKTIPNITADFHVYGVEWFEDHIDWFVDGEKFFSQKNDNSDDTYPFHKPFHIILNFAIGGDWGGAKGVDQNMPTQKLTVDYVRVYQK